MALSGHGGGTYPHPFWWGYRARNYSANTIVQGRVVRFATDRSNLAVEVAYAGVMGSVAGHKGMGAAWQRLDPNASGMIQCGGYVTNAYVNGSVAEGDFLRMDSLFEGIVKKEDISTRTGAIIGFAVDANTVSTGQHKIRMLLLPWRI